MRGPKVVLIGAGSAFFGRQTVWSMVSKEALRTGTLALVDPDERKLGWMTQIARRAIEHRKAPLSLEASTRRRDVLRKADFVILAFAREGVTLRGRDADISARHGMILCSADTIGPGGIMRTVREVPRQQRILEDVRRFCPEAWVINWVNPTSAMGIAMDRSFPDLRSVAICDGPHNPGFDDRLIVDAGLASSAEAIDDDLRRRVKIRSGGVNHFNWLLEMTCDGRDVTPAVKDRLRSRARRARVTPDEKGRGALALKIARQLADAVGYVPMCPWHTQEYLPFFQGHDVRRRGALTIRKWDIRTRRRWMRQAWDDMRNLASGRRPIADFLQKTTADHASDIVEATWTGAPKVFYLNTRNRGAVDNMPDDAYLEIPCRIDRDRVRPLPFGSIPAPLRGYMQRVLDEHELAVDAALSCDRATLRKAFLASMLAVSIPDVNACIAEFLRRERAYLPEAWYRT